MNKKGFEIQFNWILALVAGGVILLFFASVILKQKDVSETSLKADILKSIVAIITSTSVSTGTTKPIELSNSRIDVSCNRISVEGVSKQFQNLILFAPSSIKGKQIITKTLSFDIPYKATNVLYMTSNDVRYILVGDNAIASEINKSLPSELKKEFYKSLPAIKNLNNYKVRFIIFQKEMINVTESLKKIPDSDVTAVKMIGDEETGNIEFFQKYGSKWISKGSSNYVAKTSIMGGVYADTINAYECNMQNIFSRLNLVTKIYIERTVNGLLQVTDLFGDNLRCKQIYNNALQHLNNILLASGNFTIENANTVEYESKLLAIENKNALMSSCPLIY